MSQRGAVALIWDYEEVNGIRETIYIETWIYVDRTFCVEVGRDCVSDLYVFVVIQTKHALPTHVPM